MSSPWRRRWHPTPVLLPGKSHGQRSLVGASPWGRKESDTTEHLTFTFTASLGQDSGSVLDGRSGLDICSRDVSWGGRVCFQRSISGRLLECPYSMTANLPPGEQSIPDTARRKLQCLLWPNLRSATSLLPYSVIRGRSLCLAHKQGNGDEAPSFEGKGIKKFMDIF